VAFDYRTLQAMAASQPPDAIPYCPECGRPWEDPAPARAHPAARLPWRAALLVVVGLALAIAFALRAASVSHMGPRAYDCTSRPSDTHAEVLEASGRSPCIPDRAGQLQRNLLATAGGVAIALVGLGALARRRLRAGPRRGAASTLAAIWGAGEVLLTLACLQVLALYVGLVAVQLALEAPPTGNTLDRATDQIAALFSMIIRP
jgi:hypothetical protein